MSYEQLKEDPENRRQLQNLQNLMQNAKPIDEKHPGFKKLPHEDQSTFRELDQKKKQGTESGTDASDSITPEEAKDLEKLAGAI